MIEIFHIDSEQQLPHKVWIWLVKVRAGFRCEECGAADPLDAHHINNQGRGRGNDHRLANGQCLCKPCHGKIRSRQKGYKEPSPPDLLIDGMEVAEELLHRRPGLFCDEDSDHGMIEPAGSSYPEAGKTAS